MPVMINLISSNQQDETNSTWHKVVKIEMDYNGKMTAKYALSFKTGEWIQVFVPGAAFPDECILKVTE